MNFNVNYFVDNAAQIAGTEPHSTISEDIKIEATTAEEAIDLAKDYIGDQIAQNGYDSDISDSGVVAMNDGEAYEKYYRFTATEEI